MSKLYVRIRQFRTIQSHCSLSLPFPVHPLMRLAQLCDSAPTFGLLKPFRAASTIDLQGYRPNMISGASDQLQQLAEQVQLGTVDLCSVDHAIIALTRVGQAPISDVARVVLWQTFGVPVCEIFVGLDNGILGYECELHEGWHLTPNVSFTGLNGELMLDAPGVTGLHTALSGLLTRDQCPCGRPGRRLLNIQPMENVQKDRFDPIRRRAAMA
jgi:hypothetical protein